MKSPTSYGSENEEARFIRRVAAPDRPSNKRRQKKRLAIAGATLGLLAASAGVGYTAMSSAGSTNTAVKTANLKADMSNEAKAFISKLGDAFHPSFDKIDHDRDGKLSLDEILTDLTEKEMVDVDKVQASDLPEDIKKNVVALLEGKLQSDGDCAKQALDDRQVAVTRADHEIFYYMLDVFCPRVTIAVTPPDQVEDGVYTSAKQQTVEIPTPYGGTAEVIIVGEPNDGKQAIAIPDGEGGYTATEVRSIETPTGEQKILIPNAEGDITPVVVPPVPEEGTETAQGTKIVDVVTSNGDTEQVLIEGEPDHGVLTVKIPDNEGGYTETEAKVEETPTGEKIVVETADGDIIQVPVPEPVEETIGGGYSNPFIGEEPAPVVQIVDVPIENGEHEQVVVVGEVEDGKQTIKISNDEGGYTTEQVKAVETAEGETLAIPDAEGGTTVVEVPNVPAAIAEIAKEDTQVMNVVTPEGNHVQVVVEGEPEHGEQTVQIINERGDVTTEVVKAIETTEGVKLEIQTDEGYVPVVVPEVPEEIKQEIAEEAPVLGKHGGYVAKEPVQQVVEVTTATGEHEEVIIMGEAEHGMQKVEIIDESGQKTVEEVKVIETSSGEEKLVLPDVETPVVVPEVPEEVKEQAEKTGEQVEVIDAVTPSGKTEEVIIVGEPDHGKQTIEIVDEQGHMTTTEVRVEETATGEKEIMVPTDEGYISVAVPEPEPVEQHMTGINGGYVEEEPVQQVVEVTTATGEHEEVIIMGEAEHGMQKVEIIDESGQKTVEEVKVIETSSGEEKLVLPDVETPVVVPEVPEEVKEQAEKTGEQVEVIDVVTPSGKTEEVIIVGEPDHGKQTIEIVDEQGHMTTTEVRVEETATGEKEIMVPTDEGYISVAVPEPEPAEQHMTGINRGYVEEEPVQQVVEVTTATGEHEEVIIMGEAEHGMQKVEIIDESDQKTVEEVKVIETSSGEEKLVLPDVETPVVVPEVPEEVKEQAEKTGEQVEVIDVVTPSGKTEEVIIVGEPDHGKQTIEIVDEQGQMTTTEVRVEETATGEKEIMVPTDEGYISVAVPEPEPVEQHMTGINGGYVEEEPVQQVVEVTTATGEHEEVIIMGEAEHGMQKVEIIDESGQKTVEEVKVIETSSGEEKLVLPDVETPVVVPEVPEEVKEQAEKTGEQVEVIDVVTPSGKTEEVIIVGEPDHGKQTIEIVDEQGHMTTTEVRVEETATGEKEIMVPTDEGYISVAVPEPEPVEQHMTGINGGYVEEEPVQQVVEVTTATGEHEEVIIMGEAEHGMQKVEIIDESDQKTVEEVKVIETSSGEEKLVLPDVETPVVVPEVPEEVKEQAEKTGEQVEVIDVVTPSGKTEEVIIVGEPDHGKQTIEIVDEQGQMTTTEVRVEETATGEKEIMVPTDEGYISVAVPEPEPVEQHMTGINGGYVEEEPVQQVVEVTTATGEHEEVIIMGEAEHGMQKVEIIDESGQKTVEEVKVIETSSGEEKLVLPDVETPVVVPEVPEEVKEQAEKTGEQVEVIDVVTPSGKTEEVIIVGEPDHGKQTIEIVDEQGHMTTTEVRVEETATGEKEIMVPTDEGYISVAVPEPEPVEQHMTGINGGYVEEEPVQQVVEVTTATGEHEEVIIMGEAEHGMQKVEIIDESGQKTVEEVKVIETSSGEEKLVLPDVETPVVVPEVPEEVKEQAEKTGEQVEVIDVVTPSGKTEEVIIVGEPDHGKQTIEIVDEQGQMTTTEVRVEETATGEKEIMVPTDEGYISVAVPEPEPVEQHMTGINGGYVEEGPVQQVVEVTTATGEHEEVIIIGEAEHGMQKVEIIDESGQKTVEEVKVIETSSGEEKLVLPDVKTPVVVPEVPEEVKEQAEKTGEQVEVIDVVTPSGKTEEVIIVGEPDHGKQTIEIVDEQGQMTTTEVRVEETATGEKEIMVPTDEGYISVAVPEPEPVEQHMTGINGGYVEEEPVQQVVEVTTATGEHEEVIIMGEAEHGMQKVEIIDESGQKTVEEVKVIETSSGEEKLVLPDVETPVVVPEVPEEVKEQAEKTGEQVEVIDVVTPSGKTEEVIIVGEPDHGKQTIEIVDEQGHMTTTEVRVEETATGEKEIMVPTDEGYISVAVPEPEPVEQHMTGINGGYVEEEPVQQVVEVTTATGEHEEVIIMGEAEHGMQKVEIIDESGQKTVEEVKVIETSSGEEKLVLPDVETPVVVPEVPEEVKEQAEKTGEQVEVIDAVTPSGKTEEVIIVGEPDHGKQTIEIVDEQGHMTTTEVRAKETATGEEEIMVPTDEGYMTLEVSEVPYPELIDIEQDTPGLNGGIPVYEEEEPVQQVVEVTTTTGEHEEVIIMGEAEHGMQKVEIIDESGQKTVEEVKVIETSSGEEKLVLPDVETPVVVPEVPEEVKEQAEKTGEQVEVIDVVTPSGKTEEVIIVGEPDHGKQTIEIVDEQGHMTTTEVRVEETATGEKEIMVPTDEGYISVAVPEPEPVEQHMTGINGGYVEEEPVQQVVEVTTATGEHEEVIIMGEAEHGMQKVEIIDESGQKTVEEVKVIETSSGEEKLVLPDVETPVVVPEVPEEVKEQAEKTGEQVEVIDVVTPSGKTEEVIIVGEPDHGKQTIEIVDEQGHMTTTEVRVEETATGEKEIMVPTDEGYISVAVPEPEPVEQHMTGINGGYVEEEPVQQVVEVTTATGEHEEVIIMGEAEHGMQKVEIIDESGQKTVEEVKVIETSSGEEKLVLPDVETPVVVPEVPEEVKEQAEKTGEQVEVIDAVTPSGKTEEVIIVGEPDHGKQTIEIVDEQGHMTTTEVRAKETATGEEEIMVPTDEGYMTLEVSEVPYPELIDIEQDTPGLNGGIPVYEEEEPVQQVVEVTTTTGEHEEVIIMGEAEHGMQKVEIIDESGQKTVEEVKVIETSSGEEKLVLPDVETPVVVPEVPEEVKEQAEKTGEQVEVIDVVTPSGKTEEVIIVGEPDHGKQTIEIVDEQGHMTTTEVRVEETATGEKEIMVPTDEGYISVDIPDLPEEVKEEIAAEEEKPHQASKFMTKVEFHRWISNHYEHKLSQLKKEEQMLVNEERAKAVRVKRLEDCIEQAAGKFGFYGVYEQAPHFKNAVDWVQNDCWAEDRWEPETPTEHPMLRR